MVPAANAVAVATAPQETILSPAHGPPLPVPQQRAEPQEKWSMTTPAPPLQRRRAVTPPGRPSSAPRTPADARERRQHRGHRKRRPARGFQSGRSTRRPKRK